MRNESDVVIVDTSVWIDHLNNVITWQTEWLGEALGVRSVALTDLILFELLQGIRDESQFVRTRRTMSSLPVFESAGVEVATQAAEHYRLLRRRGVTVRKTVDCLVATICLRVGCSILHKDRDYDAYEKHLGLRVIHPVRLRPR